MPLALTTVPVAAQFAENKAVLIVPCHGCPRMCVAAERGQPLINVGMRGLDPFTAYIDEVRQVITTMGKTAGVMKTPASTPMMCVWPQRMRDRLVSLAASYDAIGVIGCESAVATVAGAVSIRRDAIIQLTKTTGIANFISRIEFPCTITLTPSPHGTVPLPRIDTKG